MVSSPIPDPAAVRSQRSSFLASLGRPISPPPGTVKAPIAVDISSDGESTPAKKRRRQLLAQENAEERQFFPSPFHLTRIQDLPNAENMDTITLHDILGNPLIREAWIFNYVFDVDFTMQHFDSDVRNTVSVKIIHGSWKNEDRNKQGIDDACRRWANVRAIQAYLPDAFGTHHTKMIVLLRHDDVAEIVIHTANMQAPDWTHATQAVWRSPELPILEGATVIGRVLPSDTHLGSGDRFKRDFLRYLKAYGKKLEHLVQEVSKYDFSSIRGALIGSVPSKLRNAYGEGTSMESWGHPAVFHALNSIRQMRLSLKGEHAVPATEHPHIVCQCSSVATLKAGWLQEALLRAVKAMQPNAKHTLSIVYPTAPDIAASLSGYANGPSIHMKIETAAHQKQVAGLRPHLCRWTRGVKEHAFRELAAPHVKTYISFQKEPTAEETPAINWALLTSANLSMQAWGSEAKMAPKEGQKAKYNSAEAEVHIQSYELGVLVWPELWADENAQGARCAMIPTFGKDMPALLGAAGSASTVVGLRMPYDLPLTQYTASDMPWSSHVPHPEPDRHGRTWPPDETWYD